jgi:crossover junction endodeoxyribonuclease RuvC
VLDHGNFKPPQRSEFSRKILFVADAIGDLVRKWSPQEAAVEDIFHAVNVRSVIQLAQLRGAIILELVRCDLSLFTYAPTVVKKAVTGVGSADKEQVRFMIQKLLRVNLQGQAHDVSDALAIALCHAHSRGRLQG